MSLAELIALVLSVVLALSRLVNVARPLWNYGPPWVQALLPALPPVLAQLAGELGAVQTHLDLFVAIALAALAVGVAALGKSAVAAGVLLVGFVAAGGLQACASAPPLPTRDELAAAAKAETCKRARQACNVYHLLPESERNAERDATCRDVREHCAP